ncbi:hypothetical protein CDD83_9868 [Cordyceps sp. RAO-2017]|nr:hypothetical protein CDD83_9868 [Cordyceps sp. RAO-2017]
MPVHHLMVGTWTPPGAIFTFAFDDTDLSLRLVKRTAIPADEPISWMAFSHDKKNLYGAAMKKWSSFAVESPTSIVHQVSHPMTHDPRAQSADADTRAIFLLAARDAVYCNPFYSHAGAGSAFGLGPDGALRALPPAAGTFAYRPDSAVHGMVFHPDGRHLYSADLRANKVWLHRRRAAGDPGLDAVACVDAPAPRDHPRWVAVHPAGRYLYVLMEAGNRLCEYAVAGEDGDEGDEDRLPRYTGRSVPLLPPDRYGADDRFVRYRADVCALARSARYLFASTRAADPAEPGYLAAFALEPDGRLGRALALDPTPTSGGHSNAVSPCDWSDDWLAVVEDQDGLLDIHRWRDESLERVARIRVPEPGFGMNVLWYD